MRSSGPVIQGCEVGPVLGRGGFATVYRGRQTAVGREVAIKIDSRVVDDERNRRRFLREATASGRIDAHPHVVSLIDVGTTDDNRPYLVMEYCPGGSIADALREKGVFSVADACDLGIAISSALAAAHESGILHRDIKPANILIDAYGTPRLSDFGLAALSEPGTEMSVTLEAMTPAYSAPEVLHQQVPTPRSDVWSLGATVYAMISGQPPRKRPDGSAAGIAEILARVGEPFPDPQVPGSHLLMPVIWRATHPDPAQRYPSGRELHQALGQVREKLGPGRVVVGGPEAVLTQVRPSGRSSMPAGTQGSVAVRGKARWPAVLAGTMVGILLGGIAGITGVMIARPFDGGAPSGPGASTTGGSGAAADAEKVPAVGSCWKNITTVGGNVTAKQVDCAESHAWETYASGLLDPATPNAESDTVAKDPVVKKTCTKAAAKAYLEGKSVDYRVQIIPPSGDQFISGQRGFACVMAGTKEGQVTGSIKTR